MELAYYFPKYFSNKTEELIDSSLLLDKAKAKLRYIISRAEEDKDKASNTLKRYMLNHRPIIWNINVAGNKEVSYETSFNQLLISVCSQLGLNSNKITTFEFYNAVSLLEKRNVKEQ